MVYKKKSIAPYAYIAPSMLIFGIFIFLPMLASLVLSFTNYSIGNIRFIGLHNYIRLFRDRVFWKALVNTVIYSVLVVSVSMILGLIIASILNEKWFRGSAVFRTILYVPYIVSTVAAAMIWSYMYDSRNGILNFFLSKLGLETQRFLTDKRMALLCLIVMGIWQCMGYCLVVYYSGLKTIPQNLYEAAEIDGAGKARQFQHITIPLLSSTTFFLLIMMTIQSFQVFAQILIMTDGGPVHSTTTLAHQIYINAFRDYNMGYATTQAVVLFLIVLIFAILNFKYGQKGEKTDLE